MFTVPNNPQFKAEECSNFMDSESSNSRDSVFAAAAAVGTISGAAAAAAEGPSNPRFKTEMCRNFMERAKCAYGEHCQYAHGRREGAGALQDEGQVRLP